MFLVGGAVWLLRGGTRKWRLKVTKLLKESDVEEGASEEAEEDSGDKKKKRQYVNVRVSGPRQLFVEASGQIDVFRGLEFEHTLDPPPGGLLKDNRPSTLECKGNWLVVMYGRSIAVWKRRRVVKFEQHHHGASKFKYHGSIDHDLDDPVAGGGHLLSLHESGLLARGGRSGKILIWNLNTKENFVLQHEFGDLDSLELGQSPDGQVLALALHVEEKFVEGQGMKFERTSQVVVWNPEQEKIVSIEEFKSPSSALDLKVHNSQYAVILEDPDKDRRWSVVKMYTFGSDGRSVPRGRIATNAILKFMNDTHLVTAGFDGTLYVWNIEESTPKLEDTLQAPDPHLDGMIVAEVYLDGPHLLSVHGTIVGTPPFIQMWKKEGSPALPALESPAKRRRVSATVS